MTSVDLSSLTPAQQEAIQAQIAQANEENARAEIAAAAPAEPPAQTEEPAAAPVPEAPASPTPEPPADTPSADVLEKVGQLLDRLRLSRTGSQLGAVIDWLKEHGLNL